MASYAQGYPEDRFEVAVNRNFLCPICMNVLIDPLQCELNQHYFCRPCITKHLLENSLSCPICMDKLTVDTLQKPPRIVMDYLTSLMVSCDNKERGCSEVVELGGLKNHVADCDFSPVVCSNEKCKMTMNKKDKEYHETDVCEFRSVLCLDCQEEMPQKKFHKHGCVLSKEVDKLKVDLLEMKGQLVEFVSEIRSAMTEKKALSSTWQSTKCPQERGDIVVFGGYRGANTMWLNSVEMFNWGKQSWSILPSMQQPRASATSVYYQNSIIVTGGRTKYGKTSGIEQMLLAPKEPAEQWVEYPVNLPYNCAGHKTVVHNNRLLIVGGSMSGRACSAFIYEVLLEMPYTLRFKYGLPQAISYHGLELLDDKLLIIGGSTTGYPENSIDKVWLYDINRCECKEMSPLPIAMMDMATVSWKDNVIIIGGRNRNDEALKSVFMYNYNSGQRKQLPSMIHERAESAAVVCGSAIVVVGGSNEKEESLNSAEYFTFENNAWLELPPMNEQRDKVTAVVKPV